VVITNDAAKTLRRLHTFRTLDEHAAELMGAQRADPDAINAVIGELVSGGLLVKADSLWNNGPPEPKPSISSVGFLTCRRVDAVCAAVTSYCANFQRHSRKPDLVVLDDTRDAVEARRCRERIEQLSKELTRPIRYVGTDQKQRLARSLSERTGIDEALVRFALLGVDKPLGAPEFETIGANRNAFLLVSAGRPAFCADDDTLCTLFASPEMSPGLAIIGEQDPSEFWFFPSREAAIAGASPRDCDLMAAHEEVLGQKLGDLAFSSEAKGELSLGEICDHLFDAWSAGTARVRASFAGVVGDSGMQTNALFRYLGGSSRQRIMTSESAYAMAMSSREVLRVAARRTITHGPPFMMGTVAFDYRDLAPPFFPVGRNEDGIYCATFRCVAPDACFGHVPLAVVHDRSGRGGYFDPWIATARPRFSEILIALMSGGPLSGDVDAVRMRRLGAYLQEIARSSVSSFADCLRTVVLPMLSSRLVHAEQESSQYAHSPTYWAQDLRSTIAAIRRSLAEETFWLPRDFSEGRSPEEVLALTQRLVLRFGELLEVWPELFSAATDLVVGA
jgi:hypothetical protein